MVAEFTYRETAKPYDPNKLPDLREEWCKMVSAQHAEHQERSSTDKAKAVE